MSSCVAIYYCVCLVIAYQLWKARGNENAQGEQVKIRSSSLGVSHVRCIVQLITRSVYFFRKLL